MKKIALLLVLVITFSMLTACNNKEKTSKDVVVEDQKNKKTDEDDKKADAEPIKLTVYAQYGDEANVTSYDTAVEEIKAKWPNVELELIEYVADSGQKLRTQAATGELPDIFFVTNSEINFLKESNNIVVLNDYAKEMKFDDLLLSSTRSIMYKDDGNAYCFPLGGNYVAFLFYNKELFEKHSVEVPTNYTEFKAAVQTFVDNDIVPVATFAKERWPNTAFLDMFFVQNEPRGIMKLDKGEARLSDSAYKDALNKFSELVSMGMLADGATNMGYDQAVALFNEEKAAMFVNGSWEIIGSTMSEDKFDWMMYPFNDDKPINRFAGGAAPGGFGVSPYSKHKDLAVEIAAELSKVYARVQYEVLGNPIISLKIDPSWKKPELKPTWEKWLEVQEGTDSVTVFSTALENQEARTVIDDNAQLMMVEGTKVDDIIKTVDSELDRIFK